MRGGATPKVQRCLQRCPLVGRRLPTPIFLGFPLHRRTSRVLAFDPVRRAPCDTIPSSPHLAGVRKHERASPRCRTPEQAILIENWRRSQPKIPSRSEAVRQILEQALGDAEQHVAAMS
jgi:hypothetical protein